MTYNKNVNDQVTRRKEGRFSFDINTLEFTSRLNNELLGLEAKLIRNDLEELYPNIFIMGLSRSGTTLLSQILFNNLDIACTNNLLSKFWKTPLVGSYLSKLVLNDEKTLSYESVYGRTKGAASPQGFGWFWNDILCLNQTTGQQNASKKINWKKIQSTFINIHHILDKPVVYIPGEPLALYLAKFNQYLPKSLYIYIEREPIDVAISMAKARLDYYNSLEIDWWPSLSYPKEYLKLKKSPYGIQIAGLIYHLGQMFEKEIKKIEPEKIIRIKYSDLCTNPQALLNEIKNRIESNYNTIIEQVNTPPILKVSHPKIDTAIKNNLSAGLRKFFS